MNFFISDNINIGDKIDYSQRFSSDIGEEVRLTLEAMERNGGPDAFKSIKYSIPQCKKEKSIAYYIYNLIELPS